MKMMKSTLLIVGCLAGCAGPPDQGIESTVPSLHALKGPYGGGGHPGPKVKVSKERALDTPPVLSPAHAHGSTAAFGGTQYLVVWSDFRGDRPALYGARVALDGTVLDPYGIWILDNPAPPFWAPAEQQPAVVSFDGTNFLVVTEVNGEIHGVRVSSAGAVLDPGGFPISGAEGNKYPAVEFDGVNYLVVWTSPEDMDFLNRRIHQARVAPSGTVLDPGGVFLTVGSAAEVAFDGTNYLVTWVTKDPDEGYCQVHGARISPLGVTLDPLGFLVGPPADWCLAWHSRAKVSFDGTNHVVVWRHGTFPDPESPWPPPFEELRAARVTPQGSVLDPDGIIVASLEEEAGGAFFFGFDVASGGARTTIAWNRLTYDGYGDYWNPAQVAQLDLTGAVSLIPTALDHGEGASLASSGDGMLLTWTAGWQDLPSTPIVGVRIDSQGVVDPESILISTHGNEEEVEAAASSGDVSLVVWRDTRLGVPNDASIVGSLVTPSGEPLVPSGIVIPDSLGATGMTAVFDGENFRVIWRSRVPYESLTPMRNVRVSPQGAVLDAAPVDLPICAWDSTPIASASDGTHTLIVGIGCSWEGDLAAAIVDQQGATVSVLTLGPDNDYYHLHQFRDVRVAFDGTGYLVLWNDAYDTVLAQRISPQGALLDAEAFSVISTDWVDATALGAGGGNHLAVWKTASGLFGTRIDPSGQVLDPQGFLIATPAFGNDCASPWRHESCFSVAFDGADFIVSWRAESTPGDALSTDLFGTKVSPSGAVGASFVISESPGIEGPGILTSNEEGKVLAAYSRFLPEAPYSARRARARVIK